MRESPPHTRSRTAQSSREPRSSTPQPANEPVVDQPQASAAIATRLAVPPGSEYTRQTTSSRARRNNNQPKTTGNGQKPKKGKGKPNPLPQPTPAANQEAGPSNSRNLHSRDGTTSQSRSREGLFPEPFEHIQRDGWTPPSIEIIIPQDELSSSLSDEEPSQKIPLAAKGKGKAREETKAPSRPTSTREQLSQLGSIKSLKREDLPESFRKMIAEEIRSQIGSIRSERSETRSQNNRSQIGTSRYRNTVTGAMAALFRDRDADETSSAYNTRVRAQYRAAEVTAPPMGGAVSSTPRREQPVELESSDSEVIEEDPLGPSISRATRGSPPEEVANIHDYQPEQPTEYADREIVQRIRNADIQATGHSGLPDQGVTFDQTGQGYDTRQDNRQSRHRRDARRRRSRGRRTADNPPPDGGDDSSSSSDDRGPPRGDPRNNRRRSRRRRDRSRDSRERPSRPRHRRDDGDDPSSSPSSDPRRTSTSRSSSSDTYEGRNHWLDYAGEGGPRQTRYLREIHKKYRKLIDEQVGVPIASALSQLKSLRIPSPEAYSGSEDIEAFDGWLQGLLRWLSLNHCGGPERDRERSKLTAIFLKDKASAWYLDNVESVTRRRRQWTFKKIITGLYDRFIHESSIQTATTKFHEVKYTANSGVRGFYHDLERYAARMIHAPDQYTFKTRLMMGLPVAIRDVVLKKGATAETAPLRRILRYAEYAEEVEKIRRRYNSRTNVSSWVPAAQPQRSIARDRRDDGENRRPSQPSAAQTRATPPARTPARSAPPRRPSSRPPARSTSYRATPAPMSGAGTRRATPANNQSTQARTSQTTCFRCGQLGHYANECPNGGTQPQRLTALAETDLHHLSGDENPSAHQEHADDDPNTEVMQEDHQPDGHDGEIDAETQLDGSQYTSEGEEIHLQDYEEYEDGEPDLAMGYLGIASMEGHTKEAKRLPIDRILRKSTAPKPRPSLPKEITRPIVVKMNINGLDAITMLDTGSSIDAITPEFAELSNQKVFEFTDPMAIQLGCKGSRSKSNYGSEGHIKFETIDAPHYWDIVNLDKYDAILGLPAMRKFFIAVEPATSRFTINNQPFQSLTEKEEDHELARRSAMRRANNPRSNASIKKPKH